MADDNRRGHRALIDTPCCSLRAVGRRPLVILNKGASAARAEKLLSASVGGRPLVIGGTLSGIRLAGGASNPIPRFAKSDDDTASRAPREQRNYLPCRFDFRSRPPG